jgi:acyl-CoA synthetase (AMP-forming)/AMP-acid ligase II
VTGEFSELPVQIVPLDATDLAAVQAVAHVQGPKEDPDRIHRRLAHYKCPVGVSFAPALLRTASGKLQKQAIRSSLGSLPAP